MTLSAMILNLRNRVNSFVNFRREQSRELVTLILPNLRPRTMSVC
uniref:Uncharacterized protein n=1 Tax=Anguilla anguilla TaxID=7936 RepID=A0A0E9PNN2_ANGAN